MIFDSGVNIKEMKIIIKYTEFKKENKRYGKI